MAGQPAQYAHLLADRSRISRTVGQLLSAAREAAAALGNPERWPEPEGRWRGGFGLAAEAQAVALPPGGFVELPEGGQAGEVVYLVRGRVHAVAVSSGGRLLAVRELAPERGWSLGAKRRYQLINTGSEPAAVVHVME